MNTCDVLIAGGGPAGSACAWKLREAGLHVVVVDKAIFPRDKVCAGWITPQVVAALRIDLDDYRDARTLQPFTGFRVGLIGGGEAVETDDSGGLCGVSRCCEAARRASVGKAAEQEGNPPFLAVLIWYATCVSLGKGAAHVDGYQRSNRHQGR